MKKKTISELFSQRTKLDNRIKILSQAIDDELKLTPVTCEKCSKTFHIGDLEYIQTWWYEEPYGCTGGDIWHAGEGQWECACGYRNRFYDKPNIEQLSHLFGSKRNEKRR